MKDFIVGVVSHRGIHPMTAGSIELAHQELGNRFLVKYDSGDAWLDRLRSVAITHFYTHDWADYFIFLDDDIVFSPNHLLRIYEDLKAGYRLIGGLYPTRNGTQLSSHGGGENGSIRLDGEIKEIKWLATGFMGIAKSLLRDMVEKLNLPLLHKGMWCECYPFFIFKNDETMLFSEDWEFCEKAKKVGAKVYADTSVLLGHVGEKVMTIKDVIEHKERTPKLKWRGDEFQNTLEAMQPHILKIFQGEYNVDVNIENPVILDIGANIGGFSVWASHRWGNSKIYACEPMQEIYQVLLENTKDYPNIVPMRVGIRNIEAKTGCMFHGLNNCGESSFYDIGEQDISSTEIVPIMKPQTLPKANIIKIDTEGSELEILQGLDLTNTVAIMVEIHREGDIQKIKDILAGYDLISLENPLKERWLAKFVKPFLKEVNMTDKKEKERKDTTIEVPVIKVEIKVK